MSRGTSKLRREGRRSTGHDAWREAVTAKGAPTKGDTSYKEAMREVLEQMRQAHLATSEPAPHPVWWKRLLGRPYRKGDPVRYMAELRRIRSQRRSMSP